MLTWHNGIAGSWAVLRVHGVDLATLYATEGRWSIEGRDGKIEGPAVTRNLAKQAAMRALEIMLVKSLDDVRGSLAPQR